MIPVFRYREALGSPAAGDVAAGGKRDCPLTAAVDGGWRRCGDPRRPRILGPGEGGPPAIRVGCSLTPAGILDDFSEVTT
jgi:hypothetical protein